MSQSFWSTATYPVSKLKRANYTYLAWHRCLSQQNTRRFTHQNSKTCWVFLKTNLRGTRFLLWKGTCCRHYSLTWRPHLPIAFWRGSAGWAARLPMTIKSFSLHSTLWRSLSWTLRYLNIALVSWQQQAWFCQQRVFEKLLFGTKKLKKQVSSRMNIWQKWWKTWNRLHLRSTLSS